MSTTPIGSSPGAASLDSLINQLVNRVDANKDGQISKDEFSGFLQSMLTAAGSSAVGAASVAAGAVATAPLAADALDKGVTSGAAEEAPPSTWTDNNAPYGVTFAGFSPHDHRDLTLADLGVPGKAEKYAVYSYLLANQVQPTSDWAPSVAAALNTKYNTTVYHAIDGETLGFGNEYIHSAPNGYGMLPGTYNPTATGEFFWGYQETPKNA